MSTLSHGWDGLPRASISLAFLKLLPLQNHWSPVTGLPRMDYIPNLKQSLV